MRKSIKNIVHKVTALALRQEKQSNWLPMQSNGLCGLTQRPGRIFF